ncbi:hypothetical protein SAMN03159463_00136 [Mesorhizobium sp. NFR06]|uniref:hypothetical protein n=1 Tax=Mesorhizobium sp. NFR06 TaxID=1566290 RepID=UPI0008EDD55F|nr:hypothetical protein [Mesorhizobium sp. NFR06]SFN61112.1 hypothetical protein SAMN03159463_00136 [Mesorhizobium sp. NFR06]
MIQPHAAACGDRLHVPTKFYNDTGDWTACDTRNAVQRNGIVCDRVAKARAVSSSQTPRGAPRALGPAARVGHKRLVHLPELKQFIVHENSKLLQRIVVTQLRMENRVTPFLELL